jgi:Domain of unknown function (DUF222)
MDSNRCSCGRKDRPPGRRPGPADGLTALAADVDNLAAENRTGLTAAARAERILILRRLLDRLEGHWLGELADVDALGAAGADQGIQAPSTASWLRNRLHLGAGAATSFVRTARALFRGPLTKTAEALTSGELSVARASVLAHGTHDLPDQVAAEAEPVLLDAARRMDPPRLRRVLGHLRQVADPDGTASQAERRHGRRGLWLAPTWEGMVALQGLLEAEAGQILLAALEPLARPHNAADDRSGDQRRADALTELARRNLEAGQLPQTGGVRPQLLVTVDLDSLLGHPGAVGGELGGAGSLAPEACRRLACDSALTRVLVTRQHQPGGDAGPAAWDPSGALGLQGGCGRPWPCSHRSWAASPANHSMSAGPAGSSAPPNAAPWLCATAAVSSPTATDPWPGARAITWCPGWTAAPPTWPTWPCSAASIIGRCMRAAGS